MCIRDRANPLRRIATSPVAMRRMRAAVGLISCGGSFSVATVVVVDIDIFGFSSFSIIWVNL